MPLVRVQVAEAGELLAESQQNGVRIIVVRCLRRCQLGHVALKDDILLWEFQMKLLSKVVEPRSRRFIRGDKDNSRNQTRALLHRAQTHLCAEGRRPRCPTSIGLRPTIDQICATNVEVQKLVPCHVLCRDTFSRCQHGG